MTRVAALFLACLALAAPAWATEEPRLLAQVPLVPPTENLPDDIADLVYAFWPEYYNGYGENAFTRDNLRLGRTDLNGDGKAELVLLVDSPSWEAAQGFPFVVAQWRKGRWFAIGWSWGDEDTVFVTSESHDGWHSLDSGKVVLRWQGKQYKPEEKAAP
ncbi:hypothetical protein [Magnetospirillum aberrantis]|uniref:VCBS repeat-containing protein n=1 Tax=Magnetospirillum aberrantis SpK TaxID=908842 RepID=A0A7C9UYV9_9PROT|nr:hypothetical protein [Magnetospirillum aberrantis]NFV81930.1 hypothetical protein [Magnetospirillum aberrantis SpK]